MKVKTLFPNKHRATEFFGLQIPMMEDVPLNASFDSYAVSADFVPYAYEKGEFTFSKLGGDLVDTQVHDLAFTISGDKQVADEALDKIVAYLRNVYTQIIAPNTNEPSGFHIAQRTLNSDNPEHAHCVRLLLVRIFRNEDFVCTEHPEFLLGMPIGQYHCPVCGTMVLAGIPHLPKDVFDDYPGKSEQ